MKNNVNGNENGGEEEEMRGYEGENHQWCIRYYGAISKLKTPACQPKKAACGGVSGGDVSEMAGGVSSENGVAASM